MVVVVVVVVVVAAVFVAPVFFHVAIVASVLVFAGC